MLIYRALPPFALLLRTTPAAAQHKHPTTFPDAGGFTNLPTISKDHQSGR